MHQQRLSQRICSEATIVVHVKQDFGLDVRYTQIEFDL